MKHLAQVGNIPVPGSLGGLKFLNSGGDPFVNSSLLEDVVSRAMLFAFAISGAFFLFRLISAGYSFLISGGDSAKIQSATKSLVSALIGILVVISSFFIAQMIEVLFSVNIL